MDIKIIFCLIDLNNKKKLVVAVSGMSTNQAVSAMSSTYFLNENGVQTTIKK